LNLGYDCQNCFSWSGTHLVGMDLGDNWASMIYRLGKEDDSSRESYGAEFWG
jgi:hypothetical protein